MTAQPAGEDDPDLDAIGDSHMPEDLRREKRPHPARRRDEAGSDEEPGSGPDRPESAPA
jgi:hypothetical protein